MSINGRLFLGSIDAARNVVALRRLRIGGALALLGKGEGVSAVSGHSSAVGEAYEELKLARTTVEIEDSKDGDLLCKLPKILAELKKLVIAGRSRSASVVTAWMLVNGPSQQSVQDVVDRIRDLNSDLKGIFTYSIVAATTTSVNNSSSRAQFAYLQIDKIETRELGTIDPTTLQKSGFCTVEDVLSVLRQFYESVTTSTPLLMLHFHYMCSYDESS
ncbi:hypothetical protein AM588_10010309 [Phytophthora nicotianae]|uniref:Uncharacterized protein n=1 Tax=Phytophthora nicotianae TaxID=4792 RepID=A0A0W8DU00_PHYNI|nr:hypothetical protein AM588_10010309 [Phytophthora nicotianae]